MQHLNMFFESKTLSSRTMQEQGTGCHKTVSKPVRIYTSKISNLVGWIC